MATFNLKDLVPPELPLEQKVERLEHIVVSFCRWMEDRERGETLWGGPDPYDFRPLVRDIDKELDARNKG